jgi:hypothetical protein
MLCIYYLEHMGSNTGEVLHLTELASEHRKSLQVENLITGSISRLRPGSLTRVRGHAIVSGDWQIDDFSPIGLKLYGSVNKLP